MTERITLAAADGHGFEAWRADPSEAVKGGIVVLHAVYGLTSHMADVCGMFADRGYVAIAPALFDRIGKDIVHPYDAAGVEAGSKSYAQLTEDGILADIAACANVLRPAGGVAITGFCTGGSWAWISASALDFDAAVIFYGSHVPGLLERTPRCPTILHYGDQDVIVPMQDIEKIRAAHSGLRLYLYSGGKHAFFNPEQANHDADAADSAFERSIDFLGRSFDIVL